MALFLFGGTVIAVVVVVVVVAVGEDCSLFEFSDKAFSCCCVLPRGVVAVVLDVVDVDDVAEEERAVLESFSSSASRCTCSSSCCSISPLSSSCDCSSYSSYSVKAVASSSIMWFGLNGLNS